MPTHQSEVSKVIDLKERKAVEVFGEERSHEYELRLNALWHELVQAHASMYVIDKILDFPADFLLDPEHQTFLRLVLQNFSRQVALAVINALADRDPCSLTFISLKKWIIANCLPRVRDEVSTYLQGLADPDEIKSLLKRAKELRNKLLAHFDTKYATDPKRKAQARISFTELRCLLDRTEQLVLGLCFGHGRSMLPMEYSPLIDYPRETESRSDVEYILNLLAKESTILRMPEEQEDFWPVFAKGLTEEKKKLFNEWRRKLGKKGILFE
jgi:hypothetical protein